MFTIRHLAGTTLVCLLAIASAAAENPTVRYLLPDSFTPKANAEVGFYIQNGTQSAAAAVPWPANDVHWIFARTGPTQVNRDTLPAAQGRATRSATLPTGDKVTVIGLDTKPRVTELTATEFRTFITESHVSAPEAPALERTTPEQELRVRRIESAATLVRAAQDEAQPTQAAVATGKRGQAVEIQPLFDPTVAKVGTDIPFRVFIEGSSQRGVQLTAKAAASDDAVTKSTNPAGGAHFRITHTGLWQLEFHVAKPATDDADADWVLYTGTLTFTVPEEGAAK